MERIVFGILLGSVLVGLPLGKGHGQHLEKYRWQNRLLLVFAPATPNETYLKQQELWKGQERAMSERDLLVVEVIGAEAALKPKGPTLDAAKLRAQYKVKPEAFTVILVGKDGGEKYRATAPVEAQVIYALIDGMPMRKTEVRERNQKKEY